MRLALLLLTLTLTVCWTNAQSTIANGTLVNATLNGASPLRDGLVSYWKLDETSGTRVDSYGTNNLTANNSPSYADGKVSNAASFIAASFQSLSISDNESLSVSGSSWSISCWALFNSKAVNLALVGKWGTSGNYEHLLYYSSSDDRINLATSSNGISVTILKADNFGSVPTNQWIHVFAFYNASSNQIGVVVNSANANTASFTGGINGNLPFCLGANNVGGNCMDGRIDEVGFWKRALSAAEIAVLYKSGTGTTFPYFSRRSQPLDFDWDNWQPLQLPEQIPVAFVNRKPTLISLCE